MRSRRSLPVSTPPTIPATRYSVRSTIRRAGRAPRRGGVGICPGRRPHGRRDAPEDRGPRHPVRGRRGPDGKGPGGKVTGVRTNRGDISTPIVVNCTAGWAGLISAMAGVRLPITTHPLQAAVTEPVKVFCPRWWCRAPCTSTSARPTGRARLRRCVDPVATYSIRGSLEFTEELAGHVLELMPGVSRMRLLRQWSGLCDMTPDYSPVMGFTPVDGFLVDVGWGTYGFKPRRSPASRWPRRSPPAGPRTDRALRSQPLRHGRAGG